MPGWSLKPLFCEHLVPGARALVFCPGLPGPRAAEGAAQGRDGAGEWDVLCLVGSSGPGRAPSGPQVVFDTIGDSWRRSGCNQAVQLLPFSCGRHTGSGRGQLWALVPSALPSCERVLHGHLEGVLGNVRHRVPAPNGSSSCKQQAGPGPHFRCLLLSCVVKPRDGAPVKEGTLRPAAARRGGTQGLGVALRACCPQSAQHHSFLFPVLPASLKWPPPVPRSEEQT